MATTVVYDVDARNKHVYVGMTPAEAVRNAYAQYELKDFSSAGYASRYPVSMVEAHPMRPNGKRILYKLGHFAAIA